MIGFVGPFLLIGVPLIITVLTIVRFCIMMSSKEERGDFVPNIRWSAAGCLVGILCYAYGGTGMLVAFIVVFTIILIWRVGAPPGAVRAICIIPAVVVLGFIGLREMPKSDYSRVARNTSSSNHIIADTGSVFCGPVGCTEIKSPIKLEPLGCDRNGVCKYKSRDHVVHSHPDLIR